MHRSGEAEVTKASTAPFENASDIKLCPSAFSPFSAKKIEPGVALLESKTGAAGERAWALKKSVVH